MSAPVLRPMRPSDRGHVVRSWVGSYLESDDARIVSHVGDPFPLFAGYAAALDTRQRRHGPPSLFHALHRIAVDQLLPRSDITVACLAEDDDVIVGWCAVQGRWLHYVCVKPDFQRLGVARLLVRDYLDRHMALSHWSDVCAKLPLPASWKRDANALKEALS